jgi:tetratricopeptide (TPR) repeat protein
VIQRKLVSGKNAALLVFAVLQFQIPAFAQEVCRDPAGRFASIEGRVQIRGDNQEAWRAAKQADRLCKGDSIRVGEKSRAAVVLVNEAVLRLDQNTTMRLVNISGKREDRSLIEMAQGAIKSFIRKPRLLQVNTPYLNGSVEGTEFQVSVAENAASILVLEGRILASNDQGKVTINPGEIAEAQAGAAPTSRLLVKPRDAVQWTLFYPPIQATAGDAPTNLEALDKVAESDRDAAWHINRASLLLSVGRQDEALASIDAALKLDPKAGQAHALRSIIHTVRNERPQALAEAEKGVALTDNAATRIALSYAQQADFQLDAARDTLLVAVQNNPDDASGMGAAERALADALGNRREATAAAEKAVRTASRIWGAPRACWASRRWRKSEPAQAQAAFEQAIALESADPLAHLGLGLARIRQGHLAEGRAGLETAVALDSNNALLRAYLGKAYFEEKRGPLDCAAACRRQGTRPARSHRLLLRCDPPADREPPGRGAGRAGKLHRAQRQPGGLSAAACCSTRTALRGAPARARIYFGPRLHRAWASAEATTRRDHRSGECVGAPFPVRRLPGHARAARSARVSELHAGADAAGRQPQSHPAEPPARPTSASSPQGGPASAGFNEFTPSVRARPARKFSIVSVLGGSNGTLGGEAVAFRGLRQASRCSVRRADLSETDGWRPNNGLEQEVYSVFAAGGADRHALNVQAEFQPRESRPYGDLAMQLRSGGAIPPDPARGPARARTRCAWDCAIRPSAAVPFPAFPTSTATAKKNSTSSGDLSPFFTFLPTETGTEADAATSSKAQYLQQGTKANLGSWRCSTSVTERRERHGCLLSSTVIDPNHSFDILDSRQYENTQPRGYGYLNVMSSGQRDLDARG